MKRNRKRQRNCKNPFNKNRTNVRTKKETKNDYGSNSAAPDMVPDELERAKKYFLENLNILTMNKPQIERDTKFQRDCSDWLELRKQMVTASNFGKFFKKRPNTSTANLVKNLLYTENIAHVAAVAHGVENEKQTDQDGVQGIELPSNDASMLSTQPQSTQQAPSGSQKTGKRRIDDDINELFEIVKSAKEKMVEFKDEYDIYGQYVASELRATKNENAVLQAKSYINDILIDARMGKYNYTLRASKSSRI
ncbi:unnamed protein product [Parnassius apollo]|uniref:(apollo) hypothetical protein n=1 Tax=Parnassius apollo TaxID=110799 RepID=A0A8S3XRG2_PARAO|nr:unnamed protein product [Parnassius apollo]